MISIAAVIPAPSSSLRCTNNSVRLRTLLPALVALSATPVAAQPADSGSHRAQIVEPAATEQGFIRYELTGIFTRDIVVRFAGDTLLLPYSVFANSLGILNSTSSNLDTLVGEMPLKQPFMLICSEGVAYRRGTADTLPPRSLCIIDDEVYVEAHQLAHCMGVQINVDMSELKFTVIPDSRIPVVQRRQNESIYASLAYREGNGAPVHSPVERQLFGSVAVKYGLVNSYREGESTTTGSFQLAGPFLFGLLNVVGSGQYHKGDQYPLTGAINSIGWQVQFPHSSLVTQVSASVAPSATATSLSLAASNVPLGNRSEFGVHSLDGHTQPGWYVELYEGQTLVEVTQGDSNGVYHFQIPIGYGTTRRAIHQVGPHGERLIEYRTFQLNPALIPPGSLQYSTSFLSENLKLNGRVEGRAYVSAGVMNWLTFAAVTSGASSTLRSVRLDSFDLSLHANLWLGDAIPVGLYYTPRGRTAGGAIGYNFSDDFAVQGSLDSFNVMHPTAFMANGSFSLGLGNVSLSGYGQFINNEQTTLISAVPRISLYLNGMGINASTKLAWQKPQSELGNAPAHFAATSSLQLTAVPWNGIFMLASASYDYDRHALTDIGLSSSISITNSLSLGLAYTLQRTDRMESTISAQITYDLGGIVRLGTGASYQNDRYSVISTVEGGVMISRGGIVPNTYGGVNESMIIVRAFVDRNLNGTQDDGEETRSDPSADLYSGSAQAHTDDGTFLSLAPYQEGTVVFSTERYAGEGLYPRKGRYPVYTLPGTTTVIDVPLAPGTTLDGKCLVMTSVEGGRSLSPALLTGLTVHMVSTDGAAEYEGEIFDDGTMIVDGVSEGTYRLLFDDEQLAARALRLAEPSAILTITLASTTIPEVILVKRETRLDSDARDK